MFICLDFNMRDCMYVCEYFEINIDNTSSGARNLYQLCGVKYL